jgi:forkhead box protein K
MSPPASLYAAASTPRVRVRVRVRVRARARARVRVRARVRARVRVSVRVRARARVRVRVRFRFRVRVRVRVRVTAGGAQVTAAERRVLARKLEDGARRKAGAEGQVERGEGGQCRGKCTQGSICQRMWVRMWVPRFGLVRVRVRVRVRFII